MNIKGWVTTLYPLSVVLALGFVLGFVSIQGVQLYQKNQIDLRAKNHIKIVMAADKNCNDCHLGASFVNLFNHLAVRGNDNVIIKMMDNAKIKRW